MAFGVLLPRLLAMAALTGLGAPIAAHLFRGLPRRGTAFALPAALIPFAVFVFWIGQVTFGVHRSSCRSVSSLAAPSSRIVLAPAARRAVDGRRPGCGVSDGNDLHRE